MFIIIQFIIFSWSFLQQMNGLFLHLWSHEDLNKHVSSMETPKASTMYIEEQQLIVFLAITRESMHQSFCYEGWLISKVSYREVSLVVGRTKRLRMRSVVDTV